MVGSCRGVGIFGVWVLQGYSAVGHCRDAWCSGTAGMLGAWAPQRYSVLRHCRDTWWLALQG